MKWIELIRVRSSPATLLKAMPVLRAQVAEIEDGVEGAETLFLKHALYDGDVAVVVVWRNDTEPRKSRAGLLLAEQLVRLGSVEHAVWLSADRP